MELRHIRYFVAVAEQLNFHSASKAVHVSQPAISKQIRQLEEEIGAELFLRDRNRISLTVAGKAFLSRAYELLKDARDAAFEARQAQAGLAGTVSIGFLSPCAFVVLPRLLQQLRAKVPAAKVRLLELSDPSQIAALSNREIDLAVVQTQNHSPEFESLTVAQERFALALSLQHPLVRARVARLERFLGDTFFLPAQEQSAGLREAIMTNFVKSGGIPSSVQTVEGIQTAMCLTAAGLGLTIVPESAKAMHMDGITYRPLRQPTVPVETYAIWRRNDTFPLLRVLKSSLDIVRGSLTEK